MKNHIALLLLYIWMAGPMALAAQDIPLPTVSGQSRLTTLKNNLHIKGNLTVDGTGGGGGGGAVSDVTNSDGTITVSPTTGHVVVSLPALNSGNILVGNVSNKAAQVTPSGDVTMTNTGVFAIKSSVTLLGSPVTTTQTAGDNTTKIATTAFVTAAVAASPGAPTSAQYWLGAPNGSLSSGKDLSALATGLVKNTAGTPSTAIPGTDYVAPASAFTASDAFTDSVLQGFQTPVPTATTLTATMSTLQQFGAGSASAVAYVLGNRVSKASGDASLTITYTASEDTYNDLSSTGTITSTAVANGAAAPTITANSIRLEKVVTNGTTITSQTTIAPRFQLPRANDLTIHNYPTAFQHLLAKYAYVTNGQNKPNQTTTPSNIQRAGELPGALIIELGDSTTVGSGISAAGSADKNTPMGSLQKLIASNNFPVRAGPDYFSGWAYNDSRKVSAGDWNISVSGDIGAGAGLSTALPLKMNPRVPYDSARIWYRTGNLDGGNNPYGNLVINQNGGSTVATINTNNGGSAGIGYSDVGFPKGSTADMWILPPNDATHTAFVVAVEMYDSTKPPAIRTAFVGKSATISSQWSDFSAQGNMTETLSPQPDLIIINFTINDSVTQATPIATWAADMDLKIRTIQRSYPGVDIVLEVGNPTNPVPFPSFPASQVLVTQQRFASYLKAMAIQYGCGFIDRIQRWNSWADADARGFMTDTFHANELGNADLGLGLNDAIGPTSTGPLQPQTLQVYSVKTNTLAAPSIASVTPNGAGSTTYSYVVTALGADGTESLPSATGTTAAAFAFLTGTGTWVDLVINQVPGAYAYNVYRTVTTSSTTIPGNNTTGLLGRVLNNPASGVTTCSYRDGGSSLAGGISKGALFCNSAGWPFANGQSAPVQPVPFQQLDGSPVSYHFTSAQLNTLNSAPLNLVAAPGSGKTAMPRRILFRYNYGGTQFTGGGALHLKWAGGNESINTIPASVLTTAASSDTIRYSIDSTAKQNAALQLSADTANFAAGNGSADVILDYETH